MYGIGKRIMPVFLPKYIFSKITDISPEFLIQHDIQLLLMDFDNTMLPYTSNAPTQELLDWVHKMKVRHILLCIVSNSRKPRVPEFSKVYDIPCVTHAAKPFSRGIREALGRFGINRSQAALVGDQIYTDVLGANCAGITSLIVKSIHNHTIWLKLRHVLEVPFLFIAKNRRVKR